MSKLLEEVEKNFKRIGLGGTMLASQPTLHPLGDILDTDNDDSGDMGDGGESVICEKCGKAKNESFRLHEFSNAQEDFILDLELVTKDLDSISQKLTQKSYDINSDLQRKLANLKNIAKEIGFKIK